MIDFRTTGAKIAQPAADVTQRRVAESVVARQFLYGE